MTLTAGQTIGAYQIVEQAGRGGMATVYKAHQAALARFVAVKVLPAYLAEDEGFTERFRSEAVTIAKLRHPNILQVFDYGEEGGVHYLVTEFVDGGMLSDQIGTPLPLDYVVKILLPVASALDYAHSRDVVHRDIKPSNILLARDGTPVLSDFGLARMMMMSSVPRLTRTGAVVGTPEYMAPEQAMGEDAGSAVDRYALAVIVYEMLTGTVPFSSDTPLATLLAHAHKPIPLPSEKNPKITSAVEATLLKALAKDPGDRYPTAHEFISALEDAHSAPAAPAASAAPAAPAAAPIPSAAAPSASEKVAGVDAAVGAGPVAATVPAPPAVAAPTVKPSPTASTGFDAAEMLSKYGPQIRHGIFGALVAVPLAALIYLAGFGVMPAAIASLIVIGMAVGDKLGLAFALAWAVEAVLLLVAAPGVAVAYAAIVLGMLIFGVGAERAALAIAMPVAAPFGLGPALALCAATVFGFRGVTTAAWGAVLTVIAGIVAGQAFIGPFASSGLPPGSVSLFTFGNTTPLTNVLNKTSDRFGALLDLVNPGTLWEQITDVASRARTAGDAPVATILSWALAALTVCLVARALRKPFDARLGRRSSWLTLYLSATGAGTVAGALLIVLVFATWTSLAAATGRPGADVLFESAFGGIVIALAVGLIIAAGDKSRRSI